MGPLGNGIRGQVLLASVLSFAGAYLSVRFLTRYFRTNSLNPMGYYCCAAGVFALAVLNS
jgi:undecaprenyl-diphosphatase